METMQPAPASEWRSPEVTKGIVITLPSGNNIRIKRTLDMVTMLQQGTIPNPLIDIVNRLIAGESPQVSTFSEDQLEAMLVFIDKVVMTCCLEPRVESPPMSEDPLQLAAWTP